MLFGIAIINFMYAQLLYFLRNPPTKEERLVKIFGLCIQVRVDWQSFCWLFQSLAMAEKSTISYIEGLQQNGGGISIRKTFNQKMKRTLFQVACQAIQRYTAVSSVKTIIKIQHLYILWRLASGPRTCVWLSGSARQDRSNHDQSFRNKRNSNRKWKWLPILTQENETLDRLLSVVDMLWVLRSIGYLCIRTRYTEVKIVCWF